MICKVWFQEIELSKYFYLLVLFIIRILSDKYVQKKIIYCLIYLSKNYISTIFSKSLFLHTVLLRIFHYIPVSGFLLSMQLRCFCFTFRFLYSSSDVFILFSLSTSDSISFLITNSIPLPFFSIQAVSNILYIVYIKIMIFFPRRMIVINSIYITVECVIPKQNIRSHCA